VDWGFWIIVWLICGVAAMAIGEAKGRSRGDSLMIGLVFGVLGAIWVAVVPAPPPKGSMKTVRCPRCNAQQNIPYRAKDFDCWQCKQHVAA
jgi:hypothetical protein